MSIPTDAATRLGSLSSRMRGRLGTSFFATPARCRNATGHPYSLSTADSSMSTIRNRWPLWVTRLAVAWHWACVTQSVKLACLSPATRYCSHRDCMLSCPILLLRPSRSSDPEPGVYAPGRELLRGGDPLDHQLISPATGPLTELPKVMVMTGTHDMLNPDARAFRRRAQADASISAGTNLTAASIGR